MLEVVDKDSLPCSSLPDPPSTFSGKRGHATTDTQRRPSFARSARTDEGQDVSFRRRAPAEPAVVGQTEVSQDAVQRHRDVAVIEDSNRRRRKGSGEEARRKDREVAATEAPVGNIQREITPPSSPPHDVPDVMPPTPPPEVVATLPPSPLPPTPTQRWRKSRRKKRWRKKKTPR